MNFWCAINYLFNIGDAMKYEGGSKISRPDIKSRSRLKQISFVKTDNQPSK